MAEPSRSERRLGVQLQAGDRADGPAQRLRPPAQGGPGPDRPGQRRSHHAGDAGAQAGGPEAAGGTGHDPAPGEGVCREEGGGLRDRGAGRGPVPHQHLPAARHARLRLPGHPLRGEDHSGAEPAAHAGRDLAQASRAGAGHRHYRLGQVHRARGDDPPRQPQPPLQRDHDRGSDRVPPSRRAVEHLAARGRQRHALLRFGAPARAAAGSRRHPDRRDPRRRRRWIPRSRRPTPGTWCSPRCTPPTRPRPSIASSRSTRRTSTRRSGPPFHRAAGGRVAPAGAAKGRPGPGAGSRGADQHRGGGRQHPRHREGAQHSRPDRGRHGVLRDAVASTSR